MFSLTDFHFWLSLVEIVIAFFVAFYIPGRVMLGKTSFLPERIVPAIAVVVGIVLWTWQGYIFGTLHVRWLSYMYLVVLIAFFIKGGYLTLRKPALRFPRTVDPVVLCLAVVGVVAQVFQYYDFGLKTAQGMIVTAYNPSDHIWHAGLIRELITRFPPNEPGLSGVLLKDYHFWFNLCAADLIRVFHLPLFQTQFIGMYTLAPILLVYIGYFFAKEIYDNKTFLRLFFFFLFFAGDASMWVILLLHGRFDVAVSSLINNGTKFIDSPAFGYSMIIGLTGFYLVFRFKEKVPKQFFLLTALLFGSLLEFKVYTGITFMLGLGGLALYEMTRRRFNTVIVFVLASIFGAIIFFPNLSSSGGLFYLPFATPRDFLSQSVFGLRDWQLRWEIYATHNNYLRLYQYGIYMSVIYFICQFGLQLIGFFPYKKVRHVLGYKKLIPFYIIAVSGFVLGTQFYQSIGGANIWEFFLPSGIILGFLTALILTLLLEGKSHYLRVTIFILIFIIVIPRWVLTVVSDFKGEYLTGFHGVTNAEYASYRYLESNVPESTAILVINDPHVTFASMMKVITGKNLYFSGVGVRQQTTPEIAKRQEVVTQIKNGHLEREIPTLKQSHVQYIYVAGDSRFLNRFKKQYRVVFRNSAAIIIKLL